MLPSEPLSDFDAVQIIEEAPKPLSKPSASQTPSSNFFKLLYNHNPFYVISTILMLFAVRRAYGEMEIGSINTFVMMGVLIGYTSLLALIGVLIVRFGKVWEDARSIVLLLLLMFVAVSISADDLFVRTDSALRGMLLLLGGYLFSVLLTEGVLLLTGIRFSLLYRVPLYLMLMLFFVAPWWCSPELHPRSDASAEWMIFLFPVTAGGIFLGLLPAVRKGPKFVDNNGTPWSWPLFPWSAFAFLFVAVVLRSLALCMTFGFRGEIWHYDKGSRTINFETLWGPLFLIPPLFSVMVLMLEAGFVTRNLKQVRTMLCAAPMLVLLARMQTPGKAFHDFLLLFTNTLGSPLFWSVCLLLAFYLWAWWQGAKEAEWGVLLSSLLFAFVGPRSLEFESLQALQPGPFFVVGAWWLWKGLRQRSTAQSTIALLVLVFGVSLIWPTTWPFRFASCVHLLWGSLVALSLLFRDDLAKVLRVVSAWFMPLASAKLLLSASVPEIPESWRMGYLIVMTLLALGIAYQFRQRVYLYAFVTLTGLAGYNLLLNTFRSASHLVGREAMTAFSWSLGTLLLGFLISAHKSQWLPPRLFPKWPNSEDSEGAGNEQL